MTTVVEVKGVGEIEFPDDMTPEQIQSVLGEQFNPPRTLSEKVLRGLGLAGRYVAETPALAMAGLADIGSAVANKGMEAWSMGRPIYQLPTNRAATVYEGFNRMGFPQAEGAERLSERVSRGVVGAAMGPAVGQAMAASPSAVTSSVGTTLAAHPTMQAVSAGTGATGGYAAEQAGAGPGGQLAAEMVAGALGGPAVVATGRAATTAGRTLSGIRDVLTDAGQRRVTGNVLREAAVSPERSMQRLDDAAAFGTGVTDKTTAQIARDPGLLTMERAARALDARGRFAMADSQANVQRNRVLDVMGGEDVRIAKAHRDVVTGAQREAAFEAARPVSTRPVQDLIDNILKSPEGSRKVVRQALQTYREELDGITDARVLYEIRKDINEAMQGKYSPSSQRSDFKLAKAQLKQIKTAIDIEIEKSAPGFRKYLDDYARLSRDIDQRGVIQNIQERATLAASDPGSGRDILSQARFKRMVSAERKAGVLTDDQLTVMEAIADDLDSGQAINAATVRPPGSDTAKNLTVAHIIGRAMGSEATDSPLIRNLARPVRWISSMSEEDVQGLLVEAMLDPVLARQLLAEATPTDVARAATSLRSLAAVSGAGAVSGAVAQPERTQPE